MSILDFPRVHFVGEIDWNPSTVNNTPRRGYDKANVKVDLSQVKAEPPITDPDKLLPYLLDGTEEAGPNGGWNVYGDHGCWFRETRVCSVDLGRGPVTSGDPLIGSLIQISRADEPKPDSHEDPWEPWRRKNPVLVDVDPAGGDTTSQVFFDLLRVGLGDRAGFTARATSPMFTRWPNRQRNRQAAPFPENPHYIFMAPFGVVWQATVEPIRWVKNGSRALDRLSKEARLVVRFATYRTLYYLANPRVQSKKALLEAYGTGEAVHNPARSAVVGTIGVFEADELLTANTDRLLVPAGGVEVRPVPPAGTRSVAAPPPPGGNEPVRLGPVAARAAGGRLSLDVINTFPEDRGELEKHDWQSDFVVKAHLDGAAAEIARLGFDDYGQDRYTLGGGTLDLEIPEPARKAAAEGALEVSYDGQPVLIEQEFVVDTDQRGVWINFGDPATVEFQLRWRGRKPDAFLKIGQYWGHDDPDTGELVWDRIDRPECPKAPWVRIRNGDPDAVPVKGGMAAITLEPCLPGMCILVVKAYGEGEQPPALPLRLTKLDRVAATYVAVRVLPRLDEDGPEEFEHMYEEVLQVFQLIYPTTFKDRMFASYELPELITYLKAIETRTAPGEVESRYMPITRDLSASRRAYLVRVLEKLKTNQEQVKR